MTSLPYDESTSAPQLPAAYDFKFFKQVDSLRDEAARIANDGADEGCLIWCLNQNNPRARLNKNWICNDGDLHCSILLRPEFDSSVYYQMLVVAMVSLGNAVAVHVSPMTALGYLWPNDLCIARHKIASAWLDTGISQGTNWLSITLSVNVLNAPEDPEINAMSIRESEGSSTVNNKLLLESFAREFIKQINYWSDRGYQYVFDQWRVRLQYTNETIGFQRAGESVCGIVKDVDEFGNIEVMDDGQLHTIRIQTYMGLNE